MTMFCVVMQLLAQNSKDVIQVLKKKHYSLCLQEERAKFDDIIYYMHYSFGIYGWTLHVFQKPLTGLCNLSFVTW